MIDYKIERVGRVDGLKRKFIFVLFLGLSFSLVARAEMSGSHNFVVTSYRVDGAVENSFYSRNETDYVYDGSLSWTETLGEKELFGQVDYRVTNDELYDTQDASLETFYFGIRDQYFEILGGDYYTYFSDFTVNNALKGFKVKFGDENETFVNMFAGLDSARWEDLWEKRWDDSLSRNYVGGVQLGNHFIDKKLKLAINYGASIADNAFLASSAARVYTNVVSLSGIYQMTDWLSVEAETAKSFVNDDKNDKSIKTRSDNANKAVLGLNFQSYSLTSLYSRVGSEFVPTSGFIAADTESVNLDGVLFLPGNVQLTHYFHCDRDNLSDHMSTTTKQMNPGMRLDFMMQESLTWSIGYDLRRSEANDHSINGSTHTVSLNLSKDINWAFTNAGYSRMIIVDKTDKDMNRHVDSFFAGLDGNFMLKEVQLTWDISESVNFEKYCTIGKKDVVLMHSVGLRADLPSSLFFDFRVALSDNDYYLSDYDNRINDYYVGVGRLFKDWLEFNLAYEHRGYSYTDPSRNYSETRIIGSLSCQF